MACAVSATMGCLRQSDLVMRGRRVPQCVTPVSVIITSTCISPQRRPQKCAGEIEDLQNTSCSCFSASKPASHFDVHSLECGESERQLLRIGQHNTVRNTEVAAEKRFSPALNRIIWVSSCNTWMAASPPTSSTPQSVLMLAPRWLIASHKSTVAHPLLPVSKHTCGYPLGFVFSSYKLPGALLPMHCGLCVFWQR